MICKAWEWLTKKVAMDLSANYNIITNKRNLFHVLQT